MVQIAVENHLYAMAMEQLNKHNLAASSKNSKSEEILVFDTTSLDWPFSKDDMMIMMLFLVMVMRIYHNEGQRWQWAW